MYDSIPQTAVIGVAGVATYSFLVGFAPKEGAVVVSSALEICNSTAVESLGQQKITFLNDDGMVYNLALQSGFSPHSVKGCFKS
jgi:hypothetical protein